MYIGVDDTDGPDGMCTTYLMTRILELLKGKISGYPRLVRLNPNIPYRTRGNGALACRLGSGESKRVIGILNGEKIYTNSFEQDLELSPEQEEAIWNLVKEYSSSDNNTNPGMVVVNDGDEGDFYSKTVHREVSLPETESMLLKKKARIRKLGNGRGIIGAYSAVSWPAQKITYEVLAYKYPRSKAISRKVKLEAATYAESFDFTFNSMDIRNSHPSIFPNPRTPIVYGIRGTDPDQLFELAMDLNERFGIEIERAFVFETNQGTDDHIVPFNGAFEELSSYKVTGRILNKPRPITGGHYFSTIDAEGKIIKTAAFEPTKEFRRVFSLLRRGDRVEFFGSYLNETINVEKMRVLSTSMLFDRIPPMCKRCKSRMKSSGRFRYVCDKCESETRLPEYRQIERELKPGFYEVPVCARRHLTAPINLLRRYGHT